MADAEDSKSFGRKVVRVQVPPRAPNLLKIQERIDLKSGNRINLMKYTVVERQLKEVNKRISRYKDELAIADEQLSHLQNIADDARVRSLVSETALADQERREVDQQVDSMNRHYQYLVSEIKNLEDRQDVLLEKISKTVSR